MASLSQVRHIAANRARMGDVVTWGIGYDAQIVGPGIVGPGTGSSATSADVWEAPDAATSHP
jgi:hypothetical protein